MTIDLEDIVRRAVAGETLRLRADLPQLIKAGVEAALAEKQSAWAPLHEIRGCTPAAARSFLKTHPDLAVMGRPISTYAQTFTKGERAGQTLTAARLEFCRADYEHWIRSRGKR